eukprot:1120291-Rhodomonas_salina.2
MAGAVVHMPLSLSELQPWYRKLGWASPWGHTTEDSEEDHDDVGKRKPVQTTDLSDSMEEVEEWSEELVGGEAAAWGEMGMGPRIWEAGPKGAVGATCRGGDEEEMDEEEMDEDEEENEEEEEEDATMEEDAEEESEPVEEGGSRRRRGAKGEEEEEEEAEEEDSLEREPSELVVRVEGGGAAIALVHLHVAPRLHLLRVCCPVLRMDMLLLGC